MGVDIGRRRYYFYLVRKSYLRQNLDWAITETKDALTRALEDEPIPWSGSYILKLVLNNFVLKSLLGGSGWGLRKTFMLSDDSEEVKQNLYRNKAIKFMSLTF